MILTESRKQYIKEWKRVHADRVRKYRKDYCERHPEYVARKVEKAREWNKSNIDRKRKNDRLWRKNNPERMKIIRDKANSTPANQTKLKARMNLRNAVKLGKVFKPKNCSKCSTQKIEGHHPDYEKPLQVIWLCQKHHQEVHSKIVE